MKKSYDNYSIKDFSMIFSVMKLFPDVR